MKIVVLGISGLIGSYIFKELSNEFLTIGTLRKSKNKYRDIKLFEDSNVLDRINILNFDNLIIILNKIDPDIVINCIGITKRKILNNVLEVLKINTLFPHELAKWGFKNDKKIIHFSTDCVFNGKKGNYNEESLTNAYDLYGQSKALGEIKYKNTLTIRSSFIGRELFDKTELLEWVISNNNNKIFGYKNTMYSGVSALYLASFVKKIISENRKFSGLYNLSLENPISKYDLICLIRDSFKLQLEIIPETEKIHNPTLDGSKLKNEMKLNIPSWKYMMDELAKNIIN